MSGGLIPGLLDSAGLALLTGRALFQARERAPGDRDAAARAARDLIGQGFSIADAADALGLTSAAVNQLLDGDSQ